MYGSGLYTLAEGVSPMGISFVFLFLSVVPSGTLGQADGQPIVKLVPFREVYGHPGNNNDEEEYRAGEGCEGYYHGWVRMTHVNECLWEESVRLRIVLSRSLRLLVSGYTYMKFTSH